MVGVAFTTDLPSMFFILRSCLRGHLSYLSRDWWVGTGIMNEERALVAPNILSLYILGQCPNTVNGIYPNSCRNVGLWATKQTLSINSLANLSTMASPMSLAGSCYNIPVINC